MSSYFVFPSKIQYLDPTINGICATIYYTRVSVLTYIGSPEPSYYSKALKVINISDTTFTFNVLPVLLASFGILVSYNLNFYFSYDSVLKRSNSSSIVL